jgi:hypothetical protein
LFVVLYGSETWSKQEGWRNKRLRVFESKVLRRLLGPKRGRRKLHNEKLHNLHSLPNIIRMVKSRRVGWAWHVAGMEG